MSFSKFLQRLNIGLYDDYQFEKFENKKQINTSIEESKPESVKIYERADIGLECIDDLPASHSARIYVQQRKIPVNRYKDLYYTKEFGSWIKKYDVYGRYSKLHDEERLVIPVFNQKNELVGAQGRALDSSELRYITCKWREESAWAYNINNIDFSKKIYVVEGPIDSLFLPNCIACMGSDFVSCLKRLSEYVKIEKNNLVLIFDNEKRNKEIVSKLAGAVKENYNVFIWPSYIRTKDINDLVLDGFSEKAMISLITMWTVSGLQANIELSMWKL